MLRARSFNSSVPFAAAAVLVLFSGVLAAQAVPAKGKPTAPLGAKRSGDQVYHQLCASCHGVNGEGTKRYPKALTGRRSVNELAAFIAKSMPPGPKKCPKADAQPVAAYIYEAFYSVLAQARNKPARVELSRLTVSQYRNAVTDLVGSFRPAAKWTDQRGLKGVYSKGGGRRFGGAPGTERVDPEIKFDFGTSGAIPEQDDPYQFSMRWNGSVVAPDTGVYEFIVRTDQAARLWVNDLANPLIDVYVKSGSDNVYRGSIFLQAGRAYPLRLEFSKGVQGVNDLSKLKQKPAQHASVSLEWKPPHRAEEVIPQRSLMPAPVPEVFVATAPFPADDRSMGYERGTSVSKEWEEATTEAGIETTRYVVAHLRELSGVPDDASDRAARLKEFCQQVVERAFRRPLTPELAQTYIYRQFEKAPDPEAAVKRVLLLTLKSPRFLYRELGTGAGDAYDVASRLSFGLWDSLPDAELVKAAAAGELSTREQVTKQAERMVADSRTRAKVRDFFMQWLKVDQYPDLAKDAKKYPGFDQAVASDLRTSLELFVDDVVWNEKSDFRELLLTDQIFINGRLAKLYGLNLPADAPFQRVSLDPGERAGVLTHPYLLASLAYIDNSSPIHRGVLIAKNLLGRLLQPPPQAFTPLAAELHPNMTTRQRVALQTKPSFCAGCHDMINPLGFTLEKFDAVGRLRTLENGQPIDSSGTYQTRSGATVKFATARDLATYLTTSEESHAAFVEKLFQYLVKQPVRGYGPKAVADLEKAFAANQFSIRRQVIESVVTAGLGADLTGRRSAQAAPSGGRG
jgi:mono/diheme cytochrome c family protein